MNIKKVLLGLVVATASCFQIDAETPLLMKLYGDRYVGGVAQHPTRIAAGTLDVSLGANGGRDLSATFSNDVVPQVVRVLSNGSILIAADDDNNTQIKVAKFDCDGFLDTSFGQSGVRTVAQRDVKDLFVDAQDRIVLVGGTGSSSWIARLTSNGTLDSSEFGASGVTTGDAYDFKAVGEQQSGRLIVAGKDSSGGVIFGYRSDGIADQTFNTIPGLGSRGYYQTGLATGVYDVAINPSDDTIYFVYKDASDRVTVSHLSADGSNLVSTFGDAGVIAEADRMINVTDETQVRLAMDSSGKLVAAGVNSSNEFTIRRYDADGSVDTGFNSDGSALTIGGLTAPKITHLVTTEEDQIIVLGYDDLADDRMFVARIANDGTLDTAFSADGILSYELNGSNTDRQLRFGAIHPDGRLMLVGHENDGGSDKAVLVRQYGDSYVPEYEQAPRAAVAGTLDTTFDTDGVYLLTDIDASLAGYVPRKIVVFNDSSMLMLADNAVAVTSKIVRLNPRLGLEASFNSGSVLDVNNAALVEGFAVDKKYDTTSSYVDTAQGFFVVGTSTGAPWAKHYDYQGTEDANFSFAPAAGMASGHAIVQQSSGRVLVAGDNGVTGLIAAHKIDGSLDTNFGSNGIYEVAGSSSIYAMTVDSQDRIYVAYKDGSDVAVKRICPNGDLEDSSFSASSLLTNTPVDNANIKIVLDENEDVIVASAMSITAATDQIHITRYSATGGTQDATFASNNGHLAIDFEEDIVLTDLQVQTSGKILFLAHTTANNKAIGGRLTSGGDLDTTFNPAGTTPGLTEMDDDTTNFEMNSLDMHPDRRGILVGRDATSQAPLMARIVGDDDDYVALVEQTPLAGVEGEFDKSLASDGSLDLSSLTGVGADQARVIKVTDNGKSLVGLQTSDSKTKIIKFGCDGVLESSFGSSGVTTLNSVAGISDMHLDVDGKILSVGTSGGASWLHRHSAAGVADSTFGSVGFATTNVTEGYTVREQKSGRLIMGGLDGGNGVLVGYTSKGALDTSFGSGTGQISVGTTGIHSLIIDSLDRIYVAYDNGSNQMILARYRPNGFGLDTSFNPGGSTPGQVDNALNATLTGSDQVRLAFDPDGNILVAGVETAGMKIASYDTSGSLNTGFGSSGYASLAVTDFVMTDFVIGQDDIFSNDGRFAVVGYRDLADQRMFAAWFDHSGSASTEFNPTGQVGGNPGTVSFVLDAAANATRQILSGAVLQDGRWLFAGYENDGADTPYLVRMHGQRYAEEQVQVPTEGLDGEFDLALNESGKLSFNFGTTSTLNQYGQAILSLDDGNYLVAGYGQTDAQPTLNHFMIAKYDSDGLLDASFGTGEKSGVTVAPLRDGGVEEYLHDIAVDHLGRIIAVGYQDTGTGKALIRRFAADGTVDTSFGGHYVDVEETDQDPAGIVSSDFTDAFAVGIQSSGRIIVIGEDNSTLNKGVIAAYDIDGKLDPTFGNKGLWYIEDASAVYSMAIDDLDNIYVAYKDSSTNKAVVVKLPYNGNQFVYAFGGSNSGKIDDALGVDVLSNQTVKVAVDKDDKIVVAASHVSNGTALINRFESDGTADATFNAGSALAVTATNDIKLARLMTTSLGDYVLAGYEDNSPNNSFWVARVTSAGALDTNFNMLGSIPGQNSFTINGSGTLQQLAAGTISSEGKVLVVGQESVGGVVQPIIASLYNYRYEDEVRRYPAFVSDAAYDETYNSTGIVYPYVGVAQDATLNQSVKAIRELRTGQSMSVVADGTDSWLVKINQDGSLDESFGTDGALLMSKKVAEGETIEGMDPDGYGRLLVYGTSSTNGAFVKRYRASGTIDTAFGGGSDPSGMKYNIMDEIHSVAELIDGSILVAGIEGGAGKIKMYSTAGVAVSTFATSGVYTNGEAISSLTVDADNNIYAAVGYDDGGTKKVRVVKMDTTGTLVEEYASSGVISEALSEVVRYKNVKIYLDYGDRIVIVGSWNDGTEDQIAVRRYDSDGVADTEFNSDGSKYDLTFDSQAGVTRHVEEIITLKNNKIIIVGYQDGGDTVTDNDRLFVARLKASGTLDETFNADAIANSTGAAPGMYLFTVASSLQHTRRLYSVDVQSDGRILLGGAESPDNGQDTPLVMRISGDDSIRHVERFPGYGKPGTFDVSFGNLGDGIQRVYFGNEVDLVQSGVLVGNMANGRVGLFGYGFTDADRDYKHYLFARLRRDGTYDPMIVTNTVEGSIKGVKILPTLGSNSEVMLNGMTDQSGRMVAVGYVDSATNQAMVRRYHTDNTGRLDGFFRSSPSHNGTVIYAGAEQFQALAIQGADGRLIAAGNDGTDGVLVALKDADGSVDVNFGTSGQYTFADTSEIKSVVVAGSNDCIYVARVVGSDLVVSALMRDGNALDPGFGTAGSSTVFSNITDVGHSWIAADANGKLIVAATYDDGGNSRVQVTRLNLDGTADSSFNGGSPLVVFTGDQSDRTNVITKIQPMGDGKIVIIGYQDVTGVTEDYMYALRITANGSGLDTNFNAEGDVPGLVTFRVYQTGDYSMLNNMVVDGYGRLVLVGHETPEYGGNTPVIIRLHGDYESAAVSQAPEYFPSFIPLHTQNSAGGSGGTFDAPNDVGGGSSMHGVESGWGGTVGGTGSAWGGNSGGGGWSRKFTPRWKKRK